MFDFPCISFLLNCTQNKRCRFCRGKAFAVQTHTLCWHSNLHITPYAGVDRVLDRVEKTLIYLALPVAAQNDIPLLQIIKVFNFILNNSIFHVTNIHSRPWFTWSDADSGRKLDSVLREVELESAAQVKWRWEVLTYDSPDPGRKDEGWQIGRAVPVSSNNSITNLRQGFAKHHYISSS